MERDSGYDNLRPRDYLADHESDLLADLPDFHKMNLADVDVIERTVTKCQPRYPTKVKPYKWGDEEPDKVSEVCEPESEDLEIHNLIEEGISATEEDPEIQILRGLDKLLKRIEIMQCDIRLRQQLEANSGIETDDQTSMRQDQANMDKCDGFPRHLAEIRQLQRSQHQLQCQITELLCRYAHLRTQKRLLSHQLDRVREKIVVIRDLSSVNQKWMQDTSKELAMCRKRSKHIRKGKLTKQLAHEVTETNIWSSFRYSQRYLLKNLLTRHVNDFSEEIEELRRYTVELTGEIEKRLAWITKKAIQLGRLPKALDAFDVKDDDIDDKQQSILKPSSKYKIQTASGN